METFASLDGVTSRWRDHYTTQRTLWKGFQVNHALHLMFAIVRYIHSLQKSANMVPGRKEESELKFSSSISHLHVWFLHPL